MTEKTMRKSIIELSRKHPIEIFPVESHGTTLGMADLLYSGNGHAGVIELKIAHGKDIIKVPYRPGQKAFLYNFGLHCPYVYTLIYHKGIYYLMGKLNGFPSEYPGVRAMQLSSLCYSTEIDTDFIDELLDPEPWML